MIENNFPKLRFENFKGNWNLKQLGSMCSEFKSGKYIKAEKIKERGDFPVFGANGLRGYTDTYNHEGTYALIGRQGALCGNVTLSYGKSYFTEHSIAVKASDKNDTIFLYYLLDTMNLGQYSGQSAQPGLAVNKLIKLKKSIPDVKEQAKIGSFFKNLDDTISLHQQELDALKQTKQGFLQRMFPKDGETVPEVRLPSFSDEWVPWKLSDITDLITKGTTPKNMSNEGLINFVKVENINPFSNQITSYSKISLEEHNGNLKRSQLKKNDILFSIAGTLGRTAIVKEKDLPANTNQALAILRMKNTNIDFITTYLKGKLVKDYIRKNPTIGAQPNLSLQQLKDLHVFLPSNQEQIKIGTFFRQIDEVIELKEQELEALKQTKKGFLQKMFV